MQLATGHSLVLTGRAVLPIGDGQLRFAPSGARPIAAGDFAVETD